MKFAPESIAMRAASEADRDLLWRIFRDSMRESITAARGGNWDEQRERRQFFDQLKLVGTLLIFVRNGGLKPAGDDHCAGFMTLEAIEGWVNLNTICIDPPFQSGGLGAHVVRSLQSQARQQGRPLRLSVLKANPGARRLYDRLGFSVCSETEHHIHMEWRT
jgi:ribosomal protein S18 acetylase RimI-like enzyme